MKYKVRVSRFIVSMMTLGIVINNVPIEVINATDKIIYDIEETTERIEQETERIEQETERIEQETEGIEQETEGIEQETEGIEQETEGIEQETEGIEQETEGIEQETEGIEQETEETTEEIDLLGQEEDTEEDVSSYDLSEFTGFKTVAEYDEIISSYTIEENIANNEHLILLRTLVKRFGLQNLQSIYGVEEYREGLEFLATNERALKYFVTNGDITIEGEYLKTLKAFCSIYNKYKEDLLDESDDYFNLRLAISISLAYSRNVLVKFWITSNKPIDAVTRYEVYQRLVASGVMDLAGDTETYGKWSTELFKALPIPLMKWVVSNRMNDDEIEWLADYALSKKTSTTSSDFLDAYTYITYTLNYNYSNSQYFDINNYEYYNNKYHFSDYYDDYGTEDVYRLWIVFEEGSVCGGLAKTYANLAQVFGRPSSVFGQPGHAATLTWGWNSSTNQYEWYLQNNIYGWQKSRNEYSDMVLNWGNKSWSSNYSASYLLLATDAIETEEAYSNYVNATILNLLADIYDDLDTKESIYRKALEIQGINLDSFEGLIKVYKSNNEKTSADYLELARLIVDTYTYYPLVMTDLLNYISDGITNSYDKVVFDLIKNNALTKATTATANDVKQPSVCVTMANYLIGNNVAIDLASFSFDGENAGCIVIDESYDSTDIRVRYSLDGGITWKETNDHIVKLSDEEISSITSDKDILVGLVGIDDIFTIDILEGEKISNDYITKNDITNTLEGRIENLQYSIDNGETWNDYTSGITFEGDQVVKVRYKTHGVYLQGEEDQFTFTENNETDERKLIDFEHLTVIDYSTQQSDDFAATGIIDSNPFTKWHTKFSYYDPDKYITVELDEEKYISAIEYENSGVNGRFQSVEIYVSLDNENWDLAVKVEGLANDSSIKKIDFPNSVLAKYVKIVVTESYASSSSEKNYFASGKAIYFYEDTTKTGSDNEENTTSKGIVLSSANFSDSYVRNAIASDLEISEGDIIWNIEDITELELVDTSYSIASLSGLNLFTGLIKLGITGIKANLTVNTLSLINNLTNLTDLSLSFYRITSGYNADSISTVMNELTNLIDLTSLNLHSRYNDNIITSTDATSLKNFTKLKELQITNDNGNIILEEGAISDLFELEKLTIKSSSEVKVNSSGTVESISGLPNLKYLDLSGSKLSTLENLIDFSNLSLEYLDLSNNSLTSIESLKDLIIVGNSDGEIGEVYLYGNSGLDVSEYINLPKASEGEIYKLYSEPNVDLSSLSKFVFYTDEEMKTVKTDWSADSDSDGTYTVSYVYEKEDITITSVEVEDKEYDGTTTATVKSITFQDSTGTNKTLTEGTDYTVIANFEDSSVGTNKEVTLIFESDEYYFNITADVKASITAKELTIVSVTASDKEYDGTTTANIEVTFEGLVNGESLIENTDYIVTANFDDENVGNSKAVTVTVNLTGTGTSANYKLYIESITTTASITEATTHSSSSSSSSSGSSSSGSSSSGSSSGGGGGGGSSSTDTTTESTEEEIEEESEADEEVTEAEETTTETTEETTISEISTVTEEVTFKDVENHWSKEYIYDLYEKGIISGYTDGTFKPDVSITRGDIAVIASKLLSYLEVEVDTEEVSSYTDVEISKYYYSAIQDIKGLGIMSGYTDGSFKPENTITREEFVMVIYNVMKKAGIEVEGSKGREFTDYDKISSWCKEAFDYVNEIGIISGYTDGSFNPKGEITRAEIATILSQLIN